MNLTENQKRDYQKYFIEQGQQGFSPERNKAIIDECIKKTTQRAIEKRKQYREGVAERVSAVVTYLRSLKSGTPIEQYFGKRELAHLQARKLVSYLRPDGSKLIKEIS